MSVKYRFLLFLALSAAAVHAAAQIEFVRECRQVKFPKNIPAGDYSGITAIGSNRYAVVSDKSDTDGFFVFSIDVDSITGDITAVRNDGFMGDSLRGGDCEGVAYSPSTSTLFISREFDGEIVEYGMDGKLTGRRLEIPSVYKVGMGNYGFESLAYDAGLGLFWTMNESTLKRDGRQATPQNGVRNRLRLQSFGDDLKPKAQYAYLMDAPTAHSKASRYAMGVSAVAALGDGRLLVLEREFFVPKMKLGAFVKCKLYEVKPDDGFMIPSDSAMSDSTMFLPKRLIHSFTTHLRLFDRSIANFEGMCLGPTLADGSTAVILISDSQGRYKGVLKDWLKTIVVRKQY